MGLLDKAKAAAEQAATKAKEGAQDLKEKRELGTLYGELGKTTFELVESGELTHPQLTESVEKIRALRAEENGQPTTTSSATTEVTPPPSDQPPAMPT